MLETKQHWTPLTNIKSYSFDRQGKQIIEYSFLGVLSL